MDFPFLLEIVPSLWGGLWITITLWLGSLFLGTIGATIAAVMRASRYAAPREAARAFITVIRGTPLLAQIYILYYGVGNVLAQTPAIRLSVIWPILRDGYVYALVALTISFSAYAGEILRGGIAAVPRGEIEAARSLGLRNWMIWMFIVLPRAFRISLPALGSQNVILLKSTVLASTITVMDLLGTANYIRIQTFKTYEPLFAVAVVFVILTWISALCIGALERRYSFGAR
jgi:polar amino acid transport system permease protein